MTSDLLTKTKNMLDTDSETEAYHAHSPFTTTIAATVLYATACLGMTACDVDSDTQPTSQEDGYTVSGQGYERLQAKTDSLCYKLAREQGAELESAGSGYTGTARWEAQLEKGTCEFPYEWHDPLSGKSDE